MIIDTTAAARRVGRDQLAEWLAEQRVFISSAMGDTMAERRAVAEAVEGLSARPVWFEEFGRDADAEEAYLGELEASTIYVGVLNELYGRPNPPDGDSATEIEYRRARQIGKRINVYVAAEAPGREGSLARFIERVRFSVTTETYSDVADLARRVERRLGELAAEALTPWIKVGDFVFRADEITDSGTKLTIKARVGEEIAHRLEELRDQGFGRQQSDVVLRSRVAAGKLMNVQRTYRAGGGEDLMIELGNVQPVRGDRMRAGTDGHTPDDLVELGVRSLFLGEPIPDRLGMLSFMTETGIKADDLRQAFELPNEFAEAVVRLVVVEGLVGSSNAQRVVSISVGPRNGNVRHLEIEWVEPKIYSDVEPQHRHVEGDWYRPA
ncbi:DUF4062 domain-containing protein [Kribbella sp. NPDC051770]|uniref:DUF4062 domain-containing protein n=1 Tax=Kribbella sp. NPDC051770 TaxID=3155413 RepID=UPI0034490DB3